MELNQILRQTDQLLNLFKSEVYLLLVSLHLAPIMYPKLFNLNQG